jgi:TolB-like protein/Tfp pilus assembly protein PilF
VTEPSHAVFLSYASQDVQAAQRIADALRAAGIEVWFDQSELRGGDAWDQKIRRELRDCTLFIPVISANTATRHEGYFRLEWDIADQRTHMIAHNRAFIVPVCVDGISQASGDTPESFQRVQWTRLPNGETPPAFVERVQRLLSPEVSTTIRAPAGAQSGSVGVIAAPVKTAWPPSRWLPLVIVVAISGGLVYFAIEKLWVSKPASSAPPVAASTAPAVFNPPSHSIAVLPFVNMSGDKEQEYFSEGLTEELLNSLSRIGELQVAARTSSFSFQGEHPDIATVAHKLNVAAVLEGSVRRSGHTVRITAQLVNAASGFHVWSETYDRDLRNVLDLQTEIATAVASALKVSLLGDLIGKIELGGTRNPAAFDAYLRGSKALLAGSEKDTQTAIAAYDEALRLDPKYALAFAARSLAFSDLGGIWTNSLATAHASFDRAVADGQKAISLAPELAEGHIALAEVFASLLEFTRANGEYEQAVALGPGNAPLLERYSAFAATMGRTDAGLSAARRAVQLDPLNPRSHGALSSVLYVARRYSEALAAEQDALAVDPNFASPGGCALHYALGNLQAARAACEAKRDDIFSQVGLAVIYDKLGRHGDAEAMLEMLRASGDNLAYQYAQIYAQWGDTPKALTSLDTAMRMHDAGLVFLKTDPLLDPLRREPRFQALLRELRFPD